MPRVHRREYPLGIYINNMIGRQLFLIVLNNYNHVSDITEFECFKQAGIISGEDRLKARQECIQRRIMQSQSVAKRILWLHRRIMCRQNEIVSISQSDILKEIKADLFLYNLVCDKSFSVGYFRFSKYLMQSLIDIDVTSWILPSIVTARIVLLKRVSLQSGRGRWS